MKEVVEEGKINIFGHIHDKPLDERFDKHNHICVLCDVVDYIPQIIEIPEGITFHELNAIIQLAFDWCGYHLYNFEVGATLHEDGIFIKLPELKDDWISKFILTLNI